MLLDANLLFSALYNVLFSALYNVLIHLMSRCVVVWCLLYSLYCVEKYCLLGVVRAPCVVLRVHSLILTFLPTYFDYNEASKLTYSMDIYCSVTQMNLSEPVH